MQAASDIFLGWDRIGKGLDGCEPRLLPPPAPRLEGIVAAGGAWSRKVMSVYGSDVRLDARAGPRPLRRQDRDRRVPRGAPTASTAPIAAFAEAYADQNERDYEAFSAAVKDGRLDAQTGV